MRTVLLGLLGLVLAVTVGLGVHLITRSTISLPVVRLEPAPALAPPAATIDRATTEKATQATDTETEAERPTTPSTPTVPAGSGTETDDDGSGRGRGRSGGSGGGGDDDD